MTIYIDSEFKCHLENDGTMREIDTVCFKGKCEAYIEGYRFIPAGETFVNSKGRTILGETVFPWQPYEALDQVQREYERQQLAEAQTALEIILGEVS